MHKLLCYIAVQPGIRSQIVQPPLRQPANRYTFPRELDCQDVSGIRESQPGFLMFRRMTIFHALQSHNMSVCMALSRFLFAAAAGFWALSSSSVTKFVLLMRN